jgi:23S rRNA (adenine2503-C2)-methyltransferase
MPHAIDIAAVDALRRELRIEPHALKRFRIAYFKNSLGMSAALTELPPFSRDAVAERVAFHTLTLHQRSNSQQDGATKLIFRTVGGYLIESVILRAGTGRTALCISSQIGCAAKCDFCATGKMGMAHNLPATDMVDQVVQANELLAAEERRVRNIVFMGMGEPLHNEAELYATLDALIHPALLHHPPSRILVSSVGIADAMLRLAHRYPRVNQALSLHSVREETRRQLIPLAARYPLAMLRSTLTELNSLQQKPVMLEYLLLAGVNDSHEEAAELVAWAHGLDVHVNLIPYNFIAAAPHLTPTKRPERESFARVLKAAGIPTTIRYSMGHDIEAACGQLVQQGNREVARQRLRI